MTFCNALLRVSASLALVLLAGCGGGDGGTDPDPSISISVSPSSITVEQGDSELILVTLTRGGGFTGAVSLALEGLPGGVTASNASIPAGSVQANVTLDATAAATPGTYSLTVRGSGGSDLEASTSVTLEVTEAPVPAFALSLDPTQLEFAQGAGGSASIEITRSGGFEGPVELAVSGAPSGLQATLGESEVSGGETSLDVSAASDLSPDTYTLTISGSADGLEDQSAELTVTVTESDDGGTVQSAWTFCGVPPSWFAVRDGGSGDWERVQPTGDDTFEFEASAGATGVAYVEEDVFGGSELTVYLLDAQELERVGEGLCDESGSKVVDVTVESLGADEVASLSLGSASATVFGAAGSSGTFPDVPEGPVDLFGTRARVDESDGTQSVNRFYLERDLEPQDGSSVTVDFAGEHSFDPVTGTATILGLDGDLASLFVGFGEFVGTNVSLSSSTFGLPTSDETRDIPVVPEDRRREGEFHNVFVTALPDQESPPRFRGLIGFFIDAEEIEIPLGPTLNEPTVSVASATPYVRPRVLYERQSEYDRLWFVALDQDGVSVTMLVSATHQGGGDIDLTLPDFSGTAGWTDAWGPQYGQEIEVTLGAFGWEGTGVLGPGTISDELVMRYAGRGTILEP